MSKPLAYEEVLAALPQIVSECLGVDEEEVTATANFRQDLGGESIDDLDLSFRCEKAFDVRRPFQPLQELQTLAQEAGGRPSAEALQSFCERYPALESVVKPLAGSDIQPEQMLDLYTIDVIARLMVCASSPVETQ